MNLGMSTGFTTVDLEHLQFPSKMYIDYVRVYQRSDVKQGATCDPSHHPTADYINKCVLFFCSSLILDTHRLLPIASTDIRRRTRIGIGRRGITLATPYLVIHSTMVAETMLHFPRCSALSCNFTITPQLYLPI